MKQVGMNPHIANVAGVKQTSVTGGAAKTVASKPVAEQRVDSAKTVSTPTFDQNGIQTVTRPDGSSTQKSLSGLALETSSDGAKTLTLPGGEGQFHLQGERVEVVEGAAREVSLVTNPEGLTLVAFSDKEGNHVQVHPDSMTFEIMNKNQTVSQVFHPNGFQEVVALGNEKLPDGRTQYFEKRALFDEAGSMVDQQGFSNFEVKGNKMSFDLGTGTASRTLPRPLPGHTESAGASVELNTAPSSEGSRQVGGPILMESPTADISLGADAPALSGATVEQDQRISDLKSVPSDFFNPTQIPEGSAVSETPSGVVRRTDKDTIAFSLPTGDQFRSDGELVAVLGDNPRAENARLVEEDGRMVIAYRDAEQNSYQFDVNTGDLEVFSSDGGLHQKLFADGRESISATTVYTTDAGSVKTSSHELLIDSDGTIHKQSGFANLKVGAEKLEYTLPNGSSVVKELAMETKTKVSEPEPKTAPGIAEGWGEVDDIASGILGRASGPSQTREPQIFPPTLSGVLREELAEGQIKTTLPSGISFIDGEFPYATDADGSRLEVLKREVPSEGGYILYTKGASGIGYTIAPEHMDFIVEGRDGKVHQLVKAQGEILTSITDGENKHLHQFDTTKMVHQGSPGVVADVNTPGQLYVMDSPQNRVYELPHPYPVPPTPPEQDGQGQQNRVSPPGVGQPGVQPSYWDSVKSWFGFGPTHGAAGPQGPAPGFPPGQAQQIPPAHLGGFPGGHYQYDPISEQMRSVQQTTTVMNVLSTVSIGMSMLGSLSMPTMYYPYTGGFYGF